MRPGPQLERFYTVPFIYQVATGLQKSQNRKIVKSQNRDEKYAGVDDAIDEHF